jgi:hypothetical protein
VAGPNGTQQLPQEKLSDDLDELDESMTGLQVLYEKYFLGIDRRPPEKERKRVSTLMRQLRSTLVRNTMLKFRINTMFAKLISFERMWDRTLREIEEGTYRPHLYKAKLHAQDRDQKQKKERSAPSAPSEISEDKLRKLYDTYLVARQRCGEPTTGISYESVASRIREQVPQLMEKHKARNIEFKVVIKGGKAILRAIPRE